MKIEIFGLASLAFLAFSSCKKNELQKVSVCLAYKFEAFQAEDRAKQIMLFEDSDGKKYYWLRDDTRYHDLCETVLNEQCEEICAICGDPDEQPIFPCEKAEPEWVSIWKK